jgi:S1-C subfamily serine protease
MRKELKPYTKIAKKHWEKAKKDFKKGEHNFPVFLGVMILLLIFTGIRLVQVSKDNRYLEDRYAILINEVDNLAGIQDTVTEQLALVVSASQSEFLTLQEDTKTRLAAAREEIEDARLNLEDRIVSQNSALRSVVKTWSPRIPLVECIFTEQDNQGVLSYSTTRGAGTLFSFSDGDTLLTNRHVLEEDGETLQGCDAIFNDTVENYRFDASRIHINSEEQLDFGKVDVIESPSHVAERFASEGEICQDRAAIGDAIVILGYPGIGAEGSITATEGIVSGYEDNFYITSAKVERGNSGGAAILVRENCFLGIPTFTQTGRAESLARILDARSL